MVAAQASARKEQSKASKLQGALARIKGNINVFCRVRKIESDKTACYFPMEDTVCMLSLFTFGMQEDSASICKHPSHVRGDSANLYHLILRKDSASTDLIKTHIQTTWPQCACPENSCMDVGASCTCVALQ